VRDALSNLRGLFKAAAEKSGYYYNLRRPVSQESFQSDSAWKINQLMNLLGPENRYIHVYPDVSFSFLTAYSANSQQGAGEPFYFEQEIVEHVVHDVLFSNSTQLGYHARYQAAAKGKISNATIALACTALRLFLSSFESGYYTAMVFHADIYRKYYAEFITLMEAIERGDMGVVAKEGYERLQVGMYRRGM
jgi:hypothetical protein